MKPVTKDAYALMHDGALALARVEEAGMRIDTQRLDRTIERVDARIKSLTKELQQSEEWKLWRRRYGERSNFGSRQQLGTVLFQELGYKVGALTKTGRVQVNEEQLEKLDSQFVRKYLKIEKLKKLQSTYLVGIRREVCDGYLHPSFNLHLVRTFRSCVAEGTMIEVVRDVRKEPKGRPIEDVKAGDFVYCYDDDLELIVRKVLWAGCTGHRGVIRLHWTAKGKHGYLDVTPEHQIRMANGEYVRADQIIDGDFRKPGESRHRPKRQVLAMGRCGSRLYRTNRSKVVLDHQLVYRCLVGELGDGQIIHHADGNHLNNSPNNLVCTTLSEHSSKYHKTFDDSCRKKGLQARIKNHQLHGDRWPSGERCSNWLSMDKVMLLRRLSKVGGRLTKVGHDFDTLKRKAELLGVDVFAVKSRYGRDGKYISRGRLLYAMGFGISKARGMLGINYYKLQQHCKYRGIPFERKWANQFGGFIPHNHKIVAVEELSAVDVYDIEVEGSHNFIANELCVHNSSDSPNFQNIPIRDPMMGKPIRSCFVPRDGHVLVEVDYSAIEFRVAACFWRDAAMIAYAGDPGLDVHRDMAAECYCLPIDEVTKEARFYAKNQFVFPTLYGSWYKNTARNLWTAAAGIETADGRSMVEHLRSRGFIKSNYEQHVQGVEEDFQERFLEWTKRKELWWDKYLRTGRFSLMTGFEISGVYSRNNLMNYPVQGPAFHCLLWSLTRLVRLTAKWRTRIIGQIHDSIVADVHRAELSDYLDLAKRVMTEDVREHWGWIATPLEIEAEVAEENWYEKRAVEI